MIKANELRLGNFILHKQNNRIKTVRCSFEHFHLLENGNDKDLFPIVLKPELLEKCGFKENKEFAASSEAREFILVLPIMGTNKNEIYVYVKSNKECFGRAGVNGLIASTNFYYVHQLQNLYFAFTGEELAINL